MAIEQIKVKNLSKFGVQLESGEYVNWEKTISDSDKGKVVPGGEYEVEMRRAESGKGYILSVKGANVANPSPALVAPVFKDTPTVAEIKPVYSAKSAEKTDWAAKDRSQLIGGMSHDAALLARTAVEFNVPISSIVDQYKLALTALLKHREEVK